MKKSVKIITAGALILALAGTALQCTRFVQAAEDSDFRIRGTTLTSYVGNDTFVTIPDEITIIGEGAFADNTTLTSVTLPENLQEIQYNAFGNCTALTQIMLPDSVKKVGPGAFLGCSALKMVEIGEHVSSWGSGVFNDCTSLNTLLVDRQNRYLTYYDGALYNGNMSFLYQVLSARTGENYVTPTEVTTIDTYAFWNLQNIKNIKLTNVISIAASAMAEMGSVENVILSNTVTSIGNRAFVNNSSLQQVMIPASVTNIQGNAFSGSENVSILTTRGSTAATFGTEHEIPVIYEAILTTDFNDSNPSGQSKPDLNRRIVVDVAPDRNETSADEEEESEEEPDDEDEAEEISNQLDAAAIGKTIIVNGQAMFLMKQQPVYGSVAGSKTEEEDSTQMTSTQEANTEEPSTATEEQENTSEASSQAQNTEQHQNNNNLNNNSNNSESTSIDERRYYMQKNLTNYDISEKINTIGRLAFARSGLTAINIPDSVTTIEYGAFYACENLEDVTIADSVTSIATKAFADTPWLDGWLAEEGSDDFLIVGDGILLAYRGNETQVEIPDSVKQIGSEVFKGNSQLRSVTIPDSVVRIGADAFRNCSNLSSVSGGEGLATIVRGAFYGTNVSEDSLLE